MKLWWVEGVNRPTWKGLVKLLREAVWVVSLIGKREIMDVSTIRRNKFDEELSQPTRDRLLLIWD